MSSYGWRRMAAMVKGLHEYMLSSHGENGEVMTTLVAKVVGQMKDVLE